MRHSAAVAAFAAANGLNINLGAGTPPPWVSLSALIANGDLAAGDMTTLAGTCNSVPFEPSYLGDLGLYHYEGEYTNTIQIEFDGQTIQLVQSTPGGGPGQGTLVNPRSVKSITAPRIAREITVNATEVSRIRALSSTQLETVQTRADRKLINAMRDIRATMEWHRVGAAMGVLLDADATTVLQSYFTLLGISQTQIDVLFGTPAAGKFIAIGQQILNDIEDGLGNFTPTGANKPIALCGRSFWKSFTTAADVIDAYKYFEAINQRMNPNRDDLRYEDFEHGGIIWRQYRGGTAAGRFIPDAEAHIVVQGVPGTYTGFFCPPSDITSKVNTLGEPIYATVKQLDHEGGYNIRLQSNPVHTMNRPAVAIKLYSSN